MHAFKSGFILIVILHLFVSCNKNSSTGPGVKLAAVIQQSPENEALLNMDSVLFEWDKVEDAESYELVVDDDSAFTSPVVTQQEIDETSCQLTLPGLGIYFWRVRAEGGEWSEVWWMEISFTHGKVTDIEGNVYNTIKIGDQWWMAENLKVAHYRNGDLIPNVTENAEWGDLETGARCVFDNDEKNANTYGYLYNWFALNDSSNISPLGWHVPTDEEWKKLEIALGMSPSEADEAAWRGTNEGSQLAGRPDLWNDGGLENNEAFGESGFSALPGGYRNGNDGNFDYFGHYANFWSSTEYNSDNVRQRTMDYNRSDVSRRHPNKRYGFSVRLVRD